MHLHNAGTGYRQKGRITRVWQNKDELTEIKSILCDKGLAGKHLLML